MTLSDNARKFRLEELRTEIKVVQGRMQGDADYLQRLRRERDRVARQLSEPPTGNGVSSGGHDNFAVDAAILGEIIREWADKSEGNRIVDLSTLSGVNARNIRSIKSGQQKIVTLTVAEKLLDAMGLEHLLGERLPIVSNPNLSRARIEQKKREDRLEELTGY